MPVKGPRPKLVEACAFPDRRALCAVRHACELVRHAHLLCVRPAKQGHQQPKQQGRNRLEDFLLQLGEFTLMLFGLRVEVMLQAPQL